MARDRRTLRLVESRDEEEKRSTTEAPSAGRRTTIGLVVNPVAGMGGAVGLKGTDGRDAQARARSLGAARVAPQRATVALRRLGRGLPDVVVVTFAGDMGENEARDAGVPARIVGSAPGSATTAEDTKAAVRELARAGVELVLFAGGDGTARDVMDALASGTVALGIPAGCKMHSGAFGTTAGAAGDLAARWVATDPTARRVRDAEVMDIDEDAYRSGVLAARLYGYLRVPHEARLIQSAKTRAPSDEAALAGAAAELVAEMDPRTIYVFGGGTTMRTVFDRLGFEKTLMGFDAVQGGRLIGRDLNEQGILRLLETDDAVKLVVSVIGAQGFILGRGSQQVSPTVLRRIGAANVIVIAGPGKLASLSGGFLRVDTGDEDADRIFGRYLRVRTGSGQRTLMPMATI